jgi:alkaline phosphatase
MIRRIQLPAIALLALALFFSLSACGPKAELGLTPAQARHAPRNVILLIGDGMGNCISSAARIRKGGVTGILRFDEMPVIGLVRTSSANKLVTDSAAAGTALACGVKTNNETVAMTPEGKRARTILEAAMSRGMAGGLVVTSSVTDATPAAFGSHAPSRWKESQIADGLLQNKIDLLLGGGYENFIPNSREGSARDDARDLIREAKEAGYTVCRTKEEMAAAPEGKILGLFADNEMTTEPPDPSLAEMTTEALRRLGGGKKGFFLMIEGSLIDMRAHANDLEGTLDQTLKFDKAVGIALDFAKKDGHTLVVVTADHETGGLSINDGTMDGKVLDVVWGYDNHNPTAVPLFAFGPDSEMFGGFKENTVIPRIFARLLGIADFPKILE